MKIYPLTGLRNSLEDWIIQYPEGEKFFEIQFLNIPYSNWPPLVFPKECPKFWKDSNPGFDIFLRDFSCDLPSWFIQPDNYFFKSKFKNDYQNILYISNKFNQVEEYIKSNKLQNLNFKILYLGSSFEESYNLFNSLINLNDLLEMHIFTPDVVVDFLWGEGDTFTFLHQMYAQNGVEIIFPKHSLKNLKNLNLKHVDVGFGEWVYESNSSCTENY